MRTKTPRCLAAALLLIATSSGSIALAQPASTAEAELATARALFEEGLAREDAQDWVGALQRFRRVAEIRLTPQVIYNIALCLEHLGKLASADREYARVEKAAEGSNANEPAVRELVQLAKTRRAAIRSSIPEITLDAPPSASVTKVTLDGAVLPASQWKTHSPFPIDPGNHEIVVVEKTHTARRSFTIDVGAHTTIALPIPADDQPVPRAGEEEEEGHVPTAAWITGGVTVVAIGLGVFALISKTSAMNDLDAACGPNRDRCPESKRDEADRVSSMTLLGNISLGVAIAGAVATGAIVYVGYKPVRSRQAHLFGLNAGAQGITVGGRF